MRLIKGWVAGALLLLLGLVVGFLSGLFVVDHHLGWLDARYQQYRIERFRNSIAPDIETTTLDGEKWSLRSRRGKVVVVAFFASWCKSCQNTWIRLNYLYQDYRSRSDFEIICVSLDEDRDAVQTYVGYYLIPWQVLFEEGGGWNNTVAQAFRIRHVPSVWVIDKDGRIRAPDIGGNDEDWITVKDFLASTLRS